MGHYSAIERTKAHGHVLPTWRDLESLRLRGARRKRPPVARFHCYEMSRIGKPTETGRSLVVGRGWAGVREWTLADEWGGVSFQRG